MVSFDSQYRTRGAYSECSVNSTRRTVFGLRESGVLYSVPEHGGTVFGPPSPPSLVCVLLSRQLHTKQHSRHGGTVIGPPCLCLNYYNNMKHIISKRPGVDSSRFCPHPFLAKFAKFDAAVFSEAKHQAFIAADFARTLSWQNLLQSTPPCFQSKTPRVDSRRFCPHPLWAKFAAIDAASNNKKSAQHDAFHALEC